MNELLTVARKRNSDVPNCKFQQEFLIIRLQAIHTRTLTPEADEGGHYEYLGSD